MRIDRQRISVLGMLVVLLGVGSDSPDASSRLTDKSDATLQVHAFPWLPGPASVERDRAIRVFTPERRIVTFQATVFDRDGRVAGSRLLAALPDQVVSLDELVRESAGGVWMRLDADGRLSGSCTLADARGGTATLGLAPVVRAGTLLVPRIEGSDGIDDRSATTRLALVNGGTATRVRFTPRDRTGLELSDSLAPRFAGDVPIAARSRLEVELRRLLRPGSPVPAAVEIASEGSIAAALLVEASHDSAALPVLSGAQAIDSSMLILDPEKRLLSRFQVLNPFEVDTRVTVTAHDADGARLGASTFDLRGGSSVRGVVDESGLHVPWDAPPLPRLPFLHDSSPSPVRVVRIASTAPILVYSVQSRPTAGSEGMIPAGASTRLALDGTTQGRLLLYAEGPGSATVRVHDGRAGEVLRESVDFAHAGLQVVDLDTAGDVVSVSADTGVAGVLARVGDDGPVALQPATDATPAEALPSGAELNAEPDPGAPTIYGPWRAWVEQHHHALASLTATRFDDLQFLKDLIGDRRIVQLGESMHGTAEFSSVKVRLIEFLHQQMGFDVIAFESGTFECEWTQRLDPSFDEYRHLYGSIFGVWHSDEALELFDYIRRSKRTPRPLMLTGFDPQNSAAIGARDRPKFLHDLFSPLDRGLALELYEADDEFYRNGWNAAYLIDHRNRLAALFSDALRYAEEHREQIEAARPDDPNIGKLLIVVLRNQLVRLEMQWIYAVQGNSLEYSRVRDRAMADNLDYLADELYPGRKIVTWAHNFHVRYDEPHVLNSARIRNMGYWVAQRRRSEVYTVGLFAYRGQAAFNNRVIYTIRPPYNAWSLEAVLHATGRKASFVDLLGQPAQPGNSWMRDLLWLWSWGYYGPLRKVVADNYDALLFVDTTRPPSYTY